MMLHKIQKYLLFIFFILFFISPSQSDTLPDGFPKCFQSDVNTANFCPTEAKLGHKLILVDFTSRWDVAQINWVKGRIFGNALVSTTPPYHKISYLKIDVTPPHSQKFVYSKCRFKKGEKSKFPGDETNKKCEGSDIVKNIYGQWISQLNNTEKDFFSINEGADQSLIYEYIIHVLRENSADFGSDYGERELVIVSDLMQHSERVSFYKHCTTAAEKLKPKNKRKANKCVTFNQLLEKEKSFAKYLEATKPTKEMLKNLKVTVLFINHAYQSRKDLYITLQALWEGLFKHIGIENYEIIPQLDI